MGFYNQEISLVFNEKKNWKSVSFKKNKKLTNDGILFTIMHALVATSPLGSLLETKAAWSGCRPVSPWLQLTPYWPCFPKPCQELSPRLSCCPFTERAMMLQAWSVLHVHILILQTCTVQRNKSEKLGGLAVAPGPGPGTAVHQLPQREQALWGNLIIEEALS